MSRLDPDDDYANDRTNQAPRGQALCQECPEEGTLATRVIETPWGLIKVCERHYDAAGERGATMWSTEDVGAGERMDSAYRLDRSQKR